MSLALSEADAFCDFSPTSPVVPSPRASAMGDVSMRIDEDWRSKTGGCLNDETIRLRITGNPAGPAVLILGGISAGRFVAAQDRGWWGELVGPGRAVDTDHFQVIGADYPPDRLREAVDLCPEDFARLLNAALRSAGIGHLESILGASFGGMIGLAYARLFPEEVGKLSVLCAAHRPSPMGTALRQVQRQILELTCGTNREADGVGLARQLAMTTYRTEEEFDRRFSPGGEDLDAYLRYHGKLYGEKVSAARYLTLSAAIDRHAENPRNIHVPVQVIASDTDRLVPLSLSQELASCLPRLSSFHVLRSTYGHDAFLKECRAIGPLLRRFVS